MSQNTDSLAWLDDILSKFGETYSGSQGFGDGGLTVAKAAIALHIQAAEREGMEKAKSRVLRRTEIPKDARNPTRDFVVILGEEIADIIDRDIAELTKQEQQS